MSSEIHDNQASALFCFWNVLTLIEFTQLRSGTDAFKAQGQADLLKSQQLERSDLEKQLLEDEKQELENLAKELERKRKEEMDKLNRKLALKLEGDLSEKEVRSCV